MKNVNDTQATDIISNAKNLVVVQFGATWCGPCKMLKPKMEKISNELQNVIFLYIDIDTDQILAQQNGIRSVPTILFYKNNELKQQLIGNQSEDDLRDHISKLS